MLQICERENAISGRSGMSQEYDQRYPGFNDIVARGAELDKITPALVRSPDGGGWIGSSDPRWVALREEARKVIGA